MSNSYVTILDKLSKAVQTNTKYKVEDALNKNLLAEDARKYDASLLNLLQKDKDLKGHFFAETDGGLVFKKDVFLQFISNKEFLPDSYTRYANKIGLGGDDGSLLSGSKDVVLNWPYKDAILEGGQDKEDQKRSEVFFNEVLAPDQITRLLDDKVFTNWRRYDKDGEHELDELKDDDNLIIKGNNLVVLHSLKKRYAGKVKLIYIDPPFNTGNDSFNYNDRLNHSPWITFMKNRLSVARELLSNDGNIFVHLDNNESHYLKVLMDEIFGSNNFVEEYVWSYGSASGGRAAGAKPVNIHDYIVQYSKDYSSRKQNKLYTPYSNKYIDEWFKFTDDDGRRYQRRMRGKDENGESVWVKQYLDESKGIPLTSVWADIQQVYADPRAYKAGMEDSTELAKGFSGQKPEKLLQRILEMSTDEGDLVLDYHLGSGTTAKVAHKMKRQYIGLEQLFYGDIDPVARLQKVINGDQAGICMGVEWQGGGSFVYANIMNNANKFRKRVESAKDDKEYLALLEEATSSSFLSYRVDPTKLNENEFRKLSSADKRRLLLELIDNNTLYVNYEDINDPSFKVSDTDKKFNKELYK